MLSLEKAVLWSEVSQVIAGLPRECPDTRGFTPAMRTPIAILAHLKWQTIEEVFDIVEHRAKGGI